jgi:NAD(P)-dependent dehydrogenase (short-subunit alcohol dehydrogenase family)
MSSDPISKYDSHGLNYCTRRNDTYPFISSSSQPPSLQGRFVLVTGAARGIGRAIAISFAKAGAAGIVIMDLDAAVHDLADELVRVAKDAGHATPPTIVAETADVTSREQVAAVGRAIRQAFGAKLDAIVLNAGVLEPVLKIADQDSVRWWRSYEVFVLGVFHCLQEMIPLLRGTKNGLGTVVAVNSQASTMLRPGMSGMGSAKLAQGKLLDYVNAEYGKSENGSTPLLAYFVHPGAVAHSERKDLPVELTRIQIDKPELPADCIVWLIKQRRDWLAGRFISCNWE